METETPSPQMDPLNDHDLEEVELEFVDEPFKESDQGCEPLASDSSDIDSDIDPSENKINKDAAWFPKEDAENDSLEDSYDDGDDAVYEEKSSRNNIR